MMPDTQLKELFDRYVAGQASAEEQEALFRLVLQSDQRDAFEALLEEMLRRGDTSEQLSEPAFQSIVGAITGAPVARPARRITLRQWGWAAAVLLLLVAGVYRWMVRTPQPVAQAHTTIAPGREGAVLTLADGSQVTLDSLGNGLVAVQNGTRVTMANGQLQYGKTGNTPGETAFNIMATPKGRQFHVQLPDGTDVWLNAASSIRYPVRFSDKERLVEVTGEVYVEAAQDPARPLTVVVNDHTKIAVLGTHFNINAYADEQAVSTTLLEGAIRVSANGGSVTLRPGQQAQIAAGIQVKQGVDVDQVMAWKNGLFNFEGMHLKEVMRQLERWYDITVVYEKDVPDVAFYGKLKRDLSLEELLGAFKDLDIHFRMEGRRLTVLP